MTDGVNKKTVREIPGLGGVSGSPNGGPVAPFTIVVAGGFPVAAPQDELLENAQSIYTKANPNSVLGRVSSFFANPKVVLAMKITAVAIVIAGLITASVFTFGAVPAVLAGVGAGTLATSVAAGALIGTGVGLVSGGLFSVFIAKSANMFKHTEKNLDDLKKFITLTFVTTLGFTASGAAIGALYGLLPSLVPIESFTPALGNFVSPGVIYIMPIVVASLVGSIPAITCSLIAASKLSNKPNEAT